MSGIDIAHSATPYAHTCIPDRGHAFLYLVTLELRDTEMGHAVLYQVTLRLVEDVVPFVRAVAMETVVQNSGAVSYAPAMRCPVLA